MTRPVAGHGRHRKRRAVGALLAAALIPGGLVAAESGMFSPDDRVAEPTLAVPASLEFETAGLGWPAREPVRPSGGLRHDLPVGLSGLIIRVDADSAQTDRVRIDLFSSELDYLDRRKAPSELSLAGGTHVPVEVPVGAYLLRAYLDENGNGRLDTGWLGRPTEPVAYSNGARALLGEPDWRDARFRLTGGLNTVELEL